MFQKEFLQASISSSASASSQKFMNSEELERRKYEKLADATLKYCTSDEIMKFINSGVSAYMAKDILQKRCDNLGGKVEQYFEYVKDEIRFFLKQVVSE